MRNNFRGKGRNSVGTIKSFHSRYVSLAVNGTALIIFEYLLTLELSILMEIPLQWIQITH